MTFLYNTILEMFKNISNCYTEQKTISNAKSVMYGTELLLASLSVMRMFKVLFIFLQFKKLHLVSHKFKVSFNKTGKFYACKLSSAHCIYKLLLCLLYSKDILHILLHAVVPHLYSYIQLTSHFWISKYSENYRFSRKITLYTVIIVSCSFNNLSPRKPMVW